MPGTGIFIIIMTFCVIGVYFTIREIASLPQKKDNIDINGISTSDNLNEEKNEFQPPIHKYPEQYKTGQYVK